MSNNYLSKVSAFISLFACLLIASSVVAQPVTVVNPPSPYTVPAGAASVTVEVWGGGGGGGGYNSNYTAGAPYGGGGGGGGAYSSSTYTGVVSGNYTITLTSGGGGGGYLNSQGPGGLTTTTGDGSAGGTIQVTGPLGTVSANGGQFGRSLTNGATGGAGGSTGGQGTIKFQGGKGAAGYAGSGFNNYNSGGGGGAAGNNGAGGDATTPAASISLGGVGGAGNPNAVPYIGGTGADGVRNSNALGVDAGTTSPGGGGGGCGAYNHNNSTGGRGGPGQVIITYNLANVGPHWLNQSCTTGTKGSYIDGGTIVPTPSLQTISSPADTGNYGYVFWTFNATEGVTYYFDLCSSTGTTGGSMLRIHKDRNTSPSNNYCMDANNTNTLVLQNQENGCIGTGKGLSKLIWTCRETRTYYLESADGVYPVFWGYSGNQTATLNYMTIPSFSKICSETFYDKGLDGSNGLTYSYNNNEDWIYTYYPVDTVADAIEVQFLSFSTAPGDILCVYNGNSINAPILGCFSGPSITGAFMSTANDGSLTFQFTSDDSLISTGWEANVSCVASLNVRNDAFSGGISIYPNPVKEELWLKSYGLLVKNIELYNVLGEKIYGNKSEIITDKSQITIDVHSLSSGVYFVRIENEKGSSILKFVKE